MDKLELLRKEIKRSKLGGVIIPSQDKYLNEYVPDCFRRLEWLTGFTGSAGLAIVTGNKAAFFTDGRYTLQANKQVNKSFKIYNIAETSPQEWLGKNIKKGDVISFDPKLHTENSFRSYRTIAEKAGFKLKPIDNVIDKIWKSKPPFPDAKAVSYSVKYAGKPSEYKRREILRVLKGKNADVAVIASPDSVCWLLNIRGNDVEKTPLLLSYLTINEKGKINLYVSHKKIRKDVVRHLGKDVKIVDTSSLSKDLKGLKNKNVLIDPSSASAWFFDQLRGAKANIIEGRDPCLLPKACKNGTEIMGMKRAHVRDGAAMVKFLHWLMHEVGKTEVTEISAADKLEELRSKGESFQDLSFSTISGYGANGAIVHYKATKESNARLERKGIYLLDSGAQYLDGTTDITRTVTLGNPTKEQKQNFTRVLKGHIAIASAVFPTGTRGCDLDILARGELWKVGLDYDHGTGHGVGMYLSVHEGPQGISKRNAEELLPGMIVSNEPGYYKTGEYGIRIENLILVVEKKLSETRKYLGFETLTMVPIDSVLIDKHMLTKEEIAWINAYHAQVYEKVSPLLDAASKQWLKKATTPLS